MMRMAGIHMASGSAVALNDVSPIVGRDEIAGLIGDNETGKCTLIRS